MIYKSYCSIDIEYYPFDRQNCTLKFGTWTYHVTSSNSFLQYSISVIRVALGSPGEFTIYYLQ